MIGLTAASDVPLPPHNNITGPGKNEILEKIFLEGRCHSENEDAWQEAFEIILRREKTPQNIDHGKAMFAFAVREAKRNSRIKKHNEVRSIEELYETGWEAAASNDTLVEVQAGELRRAVAQAMLLLSPPCRKVIQMRFFKGATRKETAKKLSIRSHDVSVRERDALRLLCRELLDFSPVRSCSPIIEARRKFV